MHLLLRKCGWGCDRPLASFHSYILINFPCLNSFPQSGFNAWLLPLMNSQYNFNLFPSNSWIGRFFKLYHLSQLMKYHFGVFLFVFFSARVWTQGLKLASQVLCHLCHSTSTEVPLWPPGTITKLLLYNDSILQWF
jgi:hypothetical protein